jgi:hypothetical protein
LRFVVVLRVVLREVVRFFDVAIGGLGY